MNTAIILAGGVGSRMGADRPKQFLMVQDKPIISYCFDIFQRHNEIDKVVVVVSKQWQGFVEEYVAKYGITKICGYAPAGKTRQHSIYNGLKCIEENVKKLLRLTPASLFPPVQSKLAPFLSLSL